MFLPFFPEEMWKTCQELDVKIVAFGTVGQGLLTDNLTDEKFAKIRLAKMTGPVSGRLSPSKFVTVSEGAHVGGKCMDMWTPQRNHLDSSPKKETHHVLVMLSFRTAFFWAVEG